VGIFVDLHGFTGVVVELVGRWKIGLWGEGFNGHQGRVEVWFQDDRPFCLGLGGGCGLAAFGSAAIEYKSFVINWRGRLSMIWTNV